MSDRNVLKVQYKSQTEKFAQKFPSLILRRLAGLWYQTKASWQRKGETEERAEGVMRREKEGKGGVVERTRERERKGGIKGKGGMETSKKFQTWKMPTSAQFIPLFPKARARVSGRSAANCVLLTILRLHQVRKANPCREMWRDGVNCHVIAPWRHTPTVLLWLDLWGLWTLGDFSLNSWRRDKSKSWKLISLLTVKRPGSYKLNDMLTNSPLFQPVSLA